LISHVAAVPEAHMLKWADGNQFELGVLTRSHGKVWIISITDVGKKPIFEPSADTLVLQFDDLDLDDTDFLPAKALFQPEQAELIVRFILKAHEDAAYRRDLLLVNCLGGVARSGAVAEFTKDLLGLDVAEFDELNPHIVPNKFVLQLLRDALGSVREA